MEQTGKTTKARKRQIVFVAAVFFAAVIFFFCLPDSSRDPVVDGKRLSVWFLDFANTYGASRSMDHLGEHAEVFRKAGPAGVKFLVEKLTEQTALGTKYVKLKSNSPGWVFKILPTVRLGNWGQRECAAIMLGQIGPSASNAVTALVAALDMTEVHETDKSTGASNGRSFSPFARAQAIRALEKIAPDSPQVVSALIDALTQKYIWVPKSIAVASPSTFDKSSVADYAVEVLAGLGTEFKGEIPKMLANLKYQDQRQFRGATIAAVYPAGSLAPGYGESVPRLITALNDPSTETRDAAAFDLGAIRRQEKKLAEAALPALVTVLKDPEALVRIRACETILAIDPKQFELVQPALATLLTETNYVVRLRTIDLMRQIGPVETNLVPLLTKSLEDDSRTVRTWAKESLNQIALETVAKTRTE